MDAMLAGELIHIEHIADSMVIGGLVTSHIVFCEDGRLRVDDAEPCSLHALLHRSEASTVPSRLKFQLKVRILFCFRLHTVKLMFFGGLKTT